MLSGALRTPLWALLRDLWWVWDDARHAGDREVEEATVAAIRAVDPYRF